MSDEIDYDLYVMSEIAYKDKNKLESDETLFPDNWYISKNYKLKIEIIAEALEKDTLIKNTSLYQEAMQRGLFN